MVYYLSVGEMAAPRPEKGAGREAVPPVQFLCCSSPNGAITPYLVLRVLKAGKMKTPTVSPCPLRICHAFRGVELRQIEGGSSPLQPVQVQRRNLDLI